MRSGHIKVKKGTHHLFYMAIARHTTESVSSDSSYMYTAITLTDGVHDQESLILTQSSQERQIFQKE